MTKLVSFLAVATLVILTSCQGDGGTITTDPDFVPDTIPAIPTPQPLDTLNIGGSDSIRIYDGDTFTWYHSQGSTKVRLYGIDAPEKEQEYGTQSTEALRALMKYKVLVVYIDSYDQYSRAIGRIYQGSTYINNAMVRGGHAWWYQYYAPNDNDLATSFSLAQQEKIGLWAYPNPQNPYDYRTQN